LSRNTIGSGWTFCAGKVTLRHVKRGIVTCGLVVIALSTGTRPARGDQSVIKQPGQHPDYVFEAEPHLFFGFDPPGRSAKQGFGPGFRGTVELVDNGFVKKINNTVGLGFGLDWIAFGGDKTAIWVPVVMQWNFWLSRNWSVFGEPGGGFYLGHATGARPAIYGGARFHVADKLALTARVGFPALSVGASFFF
jgi:hypothetical protein